MEWVSLSPLNTALGFRPTEVKSAGPSLSLTSVLLSKIVLFLLLLPVVIRAREGIPMVAWPRPGSAHVGELANAALSRIFSVDWVESLTSFPTAGPFLYLNL